MAKFRKLIEVSQENEVVCDNPECDFVVPNVSKNPDVDCKRYLNVACPKCGQNLLTEQDYLQWLALHKYVRFINKWFSWITIFIKEPKERQCVETHVHNGVKFTPKKRV